MLGALLREKEVLCLRLMGTIHWGSDAFLSQPRKARVCPLSLNIFIFETFPFHPTLNLISRAEMCRQLFITTSTCEKSFSRFLFMLQPITNLIMYVSFALYLPKNPCQYYDEYCVAPIRPR